MTDNIDFLYHYTNIETLALILSNHTFRFRSLDQMDDLQEKETSDLKNVGNFALLALGLMIVQRVYLCGICTVLSIQEFVLN